MPKECVRALDLYRQELLFFAPGLNDGLSIDGDRQLSEERAEVDLLLRDLSKSDFDVLKICKRKVSERERELREIKSWTL